jgi:hypothetical protein
VSSAGPDEELAKSFSGTHLRQLLLSPTYAGLRGTKAGGRGNSSTSLDGVELVNGQWQAAGQPSTLVRGTGTADLARAAPRAFLARRGTC